MWLFSQGQAGQKTYPSTGFHHEPKDHSFCLLFHSLDVQLMAEYLCQITGNNFWLLLLGGYKVSFLSPGIWLILSDLLYPVSCDRNEILTF